MQIVRKKLTADELQPPGVRYDPDSDTVQTNVDGTWVDTPDADPRTNPGGLLPARTGSTRRCDAAANMTAKVESIVNYTVASEDQASIVSTLVGFIVLFLPGIGIVAEALWLLVDLVLSIGAATVAGAFTSTVYDDMLCYFYCEMDDDGQLTADALARVLTSMSDDHSGTVYNVFSNIVADLGLVGVNNAGATGEETGDCDGCTDCPGCVDTFGGVGDFDFETTHDLQGWGLNPSGSPGQWTGSNYQNTAWSPVPEAALTKFGTAGCVTSIAVYVRACEDVTLNVGVKFEGAYTLSPTANGIGGTGCAIASPVVITPTVPVQGDQVDVTISSVHAANCAISHIIVT